MIAPQLQAPEDHHHLLEDSLSALYLYERATQHERTGNLNQAMKDYRRGG